MELIYRYYAEHISHHVVMSTVAFLVGSAFRRTGTVVMTVDSYFSLQCGAIGIEPDSSEPITPN